MKKGDKVILEPKADNLFYRNKEVIIDKWIDEEKTFRVKLNNEVYLLQKKFYDIIKVEEK
jgi:hypothetical protein